MTTIAATDERALEAARRVVARRRAAATWVASVFFAIGWTAAWMAPPAVVALVRWCRGRASWCASAVAVGWADALRGVDRGGAGGRG
jgi:hypothetical protein